MTSKDLFVTVLCMKLRRKIVKILKRKNRNYRLPPNEQFPSPVKLQKDISGQFFTRLNYWYIRRPTFELEVRDVLESILPPHDNSKRKHDDYFIGYDYDQDNTTGEEMLKVTPLGHEYLDWWGGWEDFMKRRRRTTKPIYEAIVTGVISGLVSTIGIGFGWIFFQYILPKINMIF